MPGRSSALSSVLCRPGNQAATPHPKSGVAAASPQPCRPRSPGGGTPATERRFCRCRSSALSSVLCRPGNQVATPHPKSGVATAFPQRCCPRGPGGGTPATVKRFCRAGQAALSSVPSRPGSQAVTSIDGVGRRSCCALDVDVVPSRVSRFVLQKHGSCNRRGRKSTGPQGGRRPPAVAVNSVAPHRLFPAPTSANDRHTGNLIRDRAVLPFDARRRRRSCSPSCRRNAGVREQRKPRRCRGGCSARHVGSPLAEQRVPPLSRMSGRACRATEHAGLIRTQTDRCS